MLYIYPYKSASQTAKRLARALGIRRIRLTNSTYANKQGDTIINWGAQRVPGWTNTTVLNPPPVINELSNKRSFFQAMNSYLLTPPWGVSRERAIQFIRDGHKVVARNLLNASGGRGIDILRTEQQVNDSNAPLFVKYIKKQEEYRAHIFNGEVIAINRKARVHDHPNPNWEVRNHENGFIYSREGFATPDAVAICIHNSVNALNEITNGRLTFGALDIIWNRHDNRAYLLEINTAPGLEGTLVDVYANAFRRYR